MAVVIAFLYRVVFGRIRPGFDLIVASYNYNDTLKLLKFMNILTINLNVRNIYYVANHRDVLEILYKETDAFVFEGSNRDAEWSAYQQGVTASVSEGIAPGGLIVMNDTVTTHRSFTIIRYIKFINFLRKKQDQCKWLASAMAIVSAVLRYLVNQLGPGYPAICSISAQRQLVY